jgi:hypothetical protein
MKTANSDLTSDSVTAESLAEARKTLAANVPRFPTMLRKMWSGCEVQAWIDANWTAPTQRELVGYHDKDQPNGIAWCQGFPEKLPDIVPLYVGELTSKRLRKATGASHD